MPEVRAGNRTTEFIVTLITLGATMAGAYFLWIPVPNVIAFATWVVNSGIQKLTDKTEDGKRAWEKSEFWVMLLCQGAIGVFHDFPTADFNAIVIAAQNAYHLNRTLAKAKSGPVTNTVVVNNEAPTSGASSVGIHVDQ